MRTFNQLRQNLSEDDINQLAKIIGKGMRKENKSRLTLSIELNSLTMPYYGIMERLVKNENNQWSYIVGQELTSELKIIRSLFLA